MNVNLNYEWAVTAMEAERRAFKEAIDELNLALSEVETEFRAIDA